MSQNNIEGRKRKLRTVLPPNQPPFLFWEVWICLSTFLSTISHFPDNNRAKKYEPRKSCREQKLFVVLCLFADLLFMWFLFLLFRLFSLFSFLLVILPRSQEFCMVGLRFRWCLWEKESTPIFVKMIYLLALPLQTCHVLHKSWGWLEERRNWVFLRIKPFFFWGWGFVTLWVLLLFFLGYLELVFLWTGSLFLSLSLSLFLTPSKDRSKKYKCQFHALVDCWSLVDLNKFSWFGFWPSFFLFSFFSFSFSSSRSFVLTSNNPCNNNHNQQEMCICLVLGSLLLEGHLRLFLVCI